MENGNAARVLDIPGQETEGKKRRKKRTHAAAGKGIMARSFGRGFALFLSVVCVAMLALCVVYLQKKATLTTQYESIAVLESRYNELKNDNDARYNQVVDSVSLEKIKDAALNRLGMHYATSDQIMYYDLDENSYVRQYKDVPGEG